MARLRLRTFGGLSLEGTDGAEGAMPKGRRPLALLALLATYGSRGLSRDKVTALLWPESDAERGRNSLSQVLSSLRRDHGPDDLVLGSAEIHLNAAAITSDVEEFQASIAQGDVERAVAIQSGPFLDGFYLTDAPEFERWVEEHRSRLDEKQRDALQQLAVDADRRGDHGAAVSWWRRLAAHDPTSARAAAGLMEALAAGGDGAAALRHYQVYAALIEQELNAEPDVSVVRLAERLRRGDPVTSKRLAAAPTPARAGAAAAVLSGTDGSVTTEASRPRFWRRAGGNRIYVIAALILLGGGFMAWLARVGPFTTLLSAGRLERNELLLVADFKATGPDSALGGPLAQAMRSGLSQSDVVEVAPLSRVESALGRMGRAPDATIDLSLAREIAQREGIKAVVGGTITPLSGGYLIATQLVLARTGDELASFQETAEGPRDVVDAVDRLSRKLRKRIGESLQSVRADPALAEVTTSSLDALKQYTEALQENAKQNYSRAIALLEEAIAIDSNFAMAYRQITLSMNNSRSSQFGIGGEQIIEGAFPRMRLMTERAYQLRERLPERERLQAIASYYRVSDPGKSRASFETLLRKYPRTPGAANFYATSYLMPSRDFARAESVYAAEIAIDTTVPFPYSNIVGAQIGQGKLVDARRSVERLVRQFPNQSFARRRAELQYALGHVDSSESILRSDLASSSQLNRLYARNVLTTYSVLHGKLAKVRPELEEARTLATSAGGQLLSLQDAMTLAQIQIMFFNHRDVAARMLDRALQETPRDSILEAGGQPYLRAAALYALAERPDRARAVLALYDRDVKDTAQIRRARRMATAHIALAEGRASTAVDEFRRADRILSGVVDQCGVCIDPDVGRAFDRAGMPDSAIAAFEHFINAPSVGVYWVVTDAWNRHWILRRLGELHEARGDRDAAARYYQKFVTLWKDADPGLQPTVDDVRRRLARLR